MTHWMMAFMVGLLTLTVVPPRHIAMTTQSNLPTDTQAQAIATVRYINQINDVLYAHPQNEGVVAIVSPVFPVGRVYNLRYQGRTWVYQSDAPGLMQALVTASLSSSLLGRVVNRQLLDDTGQPTGLTAPPAIPDGALVYTN